jgi:hypothetical protein
MPAAKQTRTAAVVSRRFILSASPLLSAPLIAAQEQPVPNIQQAREQAARNADTLAKFNVPRPVEPAFRFEA